ncbi:MAG: carboxypeptidase-like regulatory domain-containing protein [Myxococcales bacterium]|nr:carboxypeptidase-like regulatory domain-containing protein [Myxococcota bacterium]MDW8281068.1 carboxypeptidase-like regulatory domain-containing protein [Myxococcales bacterium]
MRSLCVLALLGCAVPGCDAEVLPVACAGEMECPPPSPLLSWAAELWPGLGGSGQRTADKALVPQEEPTLVFGAGGMATLQFRPPALLRGTIVDDAGEPIGRARVVATLPSAIPGQSAKRFEATTDPDGRFSLRLPVPAVPAMQPYHLWVGFDDTRAVDRPPLWQRELVVWGDMELTLRTKKLSQLAVVRGRIVDLFGAGVSGMRVQVLDSRREVVSSTAFSLEDPSHPDLQGTFRILVDPQLSQDSRLQLMAWPGPQGKDLPILSRPLSGLQPGSTHSVELRLPAYRRPLPFTILVRGTGTSGAALPVPGARVWAQVLLETGEQTATYIAVGDTDAQGQVSLSLVPATTLNLQYTLTVQSPPGSPLGSAVLPLLVGREGGFVAVALPLRTQLSGRLVSAEGEPVAGAQILARNISQEGQATSLVGRALLEAVMPQTMTGPDGRFALRLDQGDYDLDIIPPPGVQPRHTLRNQRVLTDDTELGYIRLPRPTLGRVQVLRPDGSPATDAILRVFELPDTTPRSGFACAELLPCSRQAALRAEVTTDSRGRSQFLLPDVPSAR